MGLLDELDEIDRQKSLAAKTNEVGLAAELDEIDALDTQYHLNKGLRTAFPVLSSEYGDSLAAQQQMQSELGSLQKAQQFYPDFQQRKKQAEIDTMQGSGMKNTAVAALNIVPEAMRILGQGTQLVTGGEFGQGLENLATGVSQDIYRDYATPKLLEQQKLLATAPDKLGAILSNPGATATIAAPSLVASMAPSTMLGSVAGKAALRYGLGAQRAGDIAGDVANLSNVFMNASQGFAEKNAEGMNPLQNLIGATAGAIVNRAIGSKTGGGAEGALARAMTGGGTGAVGKALLAGPVKGALDELGDNLSIEASKAVSENRTPEIGKTVEDSLIDMFAGAFLGGAGDVSSAMQTNKQAKEIKADPVAKAIWDLEQEEKAKAEQTKAQPVPKQEQPVQEAEPKANPVLAALSKLQEKVEAEKPQEQVEAEPVAQPQQSETPVVASEPQAEVRRIDRKILQNRERDDDDSLLQMRTIANNPDYGRVGYSRDFANGAPVVAFGSIPEEQKGRTDYAVAVTGERIPVQYAVVDADSVSTSNDINGFENPDYGLTDRVMAVAGNGRVTALGQAYRQGSAQNYRQELTEDTMHGINPEVIAKMKNPILVRIMPNERVRDDIGDLSNISSNKSLSAIEQAHNDARRIDLDGLQFNDDGSVTSQSLAQFVAAMPPTERGALMDKEGRPSSQAVDRLNNAIFAKAYNNDDITAMYAEATDPEAKLVVNALARLAPKMAKLEGCGELDFRNALVDAVNAIVQGKRKGLNMQDILAQQDFLADPDVALFIGLFARNPRSNKDVVAILSEAADFAYNEAIKPDEDMFGEVQKASRGDVMNYVRDEFNKVKEAKNGKQAKQQAALQDASGSIGTSQNVDGRDAGANQGTNERAGSANAQADEGFSLSGQTEQEIIADEKAEEERQAQAKREADEDAKQQAKEDFNKEVDSLNEGYAENFSLEDDTVSAEDALRGQKPLFSKAGSSNAQEREEIAHMHRLRWDIDQLERSLKAIQKQNVKSVSAIPNAMYEEFGLGYGTMLNRFIRKVKEDNEGKRINLAMVVAEVKAEIASLKEKLAKQQEVVDALGGSDALRDQKLVFSRNPRTGKMDIKLSIAWHGSPHVFEVFLTDHIGTGEGAQAHGWGLYFALDRKVAEHYRNALAGSQILYKGKDISQLRDRLNAERDYEKVAVIDEFMDKQSIPALRDEVPSLIEDEMLSQEAWDWFEKEVAPNIKQAGRLFKVEIPDADVMLDEQKVLKDQPKFVQDAVDQVIEDLKANGLLSDSEYKWFKRNALDLNGFDIYWTIGAKYDKKYGDDFDSTKAASLLLNKHGIKGIRYDGRRDGPCAVVFDDAAVKVLEFYSKNKPQESTGITVGDVTTALEADKDIGEAFKTLSESGEVNVVQTIEGLPEDIQKLIGTETESKFSIKRSDNGDIQGLYDPRTGKAYLIADALTNETAKPVFLHELGVHASYGKNPLKLESQMKLARNMVNNGYAQGNDMAIRVKQRLFDANEIDSMDAPIPMDAAEECMSYLVEETASSDDRGPFRKWFDSVITAIKQWLRSHGINVNLNEWDFVEIAKGNVVAMAKQSGKDMTLSYSKKGKKLVRNKTINRKEPSYKSDERFGRFTEGGFRPEPSEDVKALRNKQPSENGGRFLERDELGRFRLKAGRKLIEGLGYTVAAVDSLLPVAYKISNAPQALRIQIRDMKAKIEKAGMDATEMAKLMKEMPEAERKLISDVVEQELETGINPPDHVMQIATKITQIMDEQSKELVELGMLSQESYERYRGKYLPRFYLRADEKEQIGFFAKIFGGRARMRGVAGTHLKGRGIFKEVPAKAAHNFIKLGWEVRDPNYEYVNGKVQPRQGRVEGVDDTGMVMIWRDYRKEEREEMGEIRDASYRFAVGYMETQRDLAIGRLFKAIASNPDWTSSTAREGFVYVPKNEVPDAGGVLKYGALAGKYVDEVVFSHISHIDDIPDGLMRAFRQGMAFWKEGKTAMNPVSHMNNTVNNFVAAHLGGVDMWDVKAYSKALHSMRTADESFKEAQDAGLFTGSFSQEEFVKSLPEDLRNMAQQEETGFKKFGDLLMRIFTWGLRDKLRKAYEFEDAFFKMAIYQKAREAGMDPSHAVDYAHKFVFVYDTLPGMAQKLRNFLFPFFAWTYQAIPMLATTAVCYPWRFFAPAAILYALNKAQFLAAAGDDDDTWAERWKKASQLEDAERTLLPKYMQGNTLFMTPKFLRLGIDEATGLPQYLNLSHMVPGGNFLDFENQNGGVPLPEIMMPNHPLINGLAAYIFNQDAFSGFDMTKETDTTGEKVQKYAEYTWKQLTPAIAIGNYHWNRLMDGVAGATGVTMPIDRTGVNRHGEVTTLDVAIQNMMGLKVRTFDPDNELNRQLRGHKSDMSMIQSEKRSAYRRARAGALPIDSYQDYAKTADEKVRKVRGEMGELRKARATVKDLSGK